MRNIKNMKNMDRIVGCEKALDFGMLFLGGDLGSGLSSFRIGFTEKKMLN